MRVMFSIVILVVVLFCCKYFVAVSTTILCFPSPPPSSLAHTFACNANDHCCSNDDHSRRRQACAVVYSDQVMECRKHRLCIFTCAPSLRRLQLLHQCFLSARIPSVEPLKFAAWHSQCIRTKIGEHKADNLPPALCSP